MKNIRLMRWLVLALLVLDAVDLIWSAGRLLTLKEADDNADGGKS